MILDLFRKEVQFDNILGYDDIVGTSNTVITDAINNAIEEASKTVKNIKWGELGRVTFRVEEGKKIEYQAEVRIAFEVIRNTED